ncbi:MAG TPA: ABC transporter substrate-binding protein [Solirubrobacteraceae bacterium]|nr:ABC transporter substrate-binding protein [Solirubrobacteraceae bacterium]
MSILDLSGGTGLVPQNEDGVLTAVAAINAAGGINGRPLQAIICDTKSDPNGAASCAHQAVSDGVAALVGSETQLEANYLPIIEQAGIANIGIVPIGAPAFTSSTAFPLSSGTTASFSGQALELVDQGATKISLVAIDVPQATAFAPVINIGLKSKNLQLSGTVLVPSPSPDMASYVAAATRGGVNGIEVLLLSADAVKFVQAAHQAGVTAKIGMITQDPEGLIKALGPLADGIYMTSDSKLLAQTSDPAVAKYLADAKLAGKPASGRAMADGWAPVQLFQLAAKSATTIDAAGILAAMKALTNADVGVYPPINYTQHITELPLTHIFNDKVVFAVVKNGQEVPLTGQFVNAFGQ